MADIIPKELYQVFDFSGQAAAVAASATYVGANAVLTITNNSENVIWIPENTILVSTDQVYEAVAYATWTGPDPVTEQITRYMYNDANFSKVLPMRMIVLKPGERFRMRVFNRAPAAAADISISGSLYEIEARLFDQVITKLRNDFERGIK